MAQSFVLPRGPAEVLLESVLWTETSGEDFYLQIPGVDGSGGLDGCPHAATCQVRRIGRLTA
eukprot:2239176-Prorocentrum_lima.AAC.1